MYAQHRSCNTDLRLGITDGAYKSAIKDRGGVPEHISCTIRGCESGVWHGFNESPVRYLIDGTTFKSPYYHDIAPQDRENV